MYESPIKLLFPRFDDVISDMAKKQDDMVFDAVARFGVIVDKGELLRALHYDRDQYNRGFNDGIMAAADELVRCKDCKYRDELSKQCACPMAIGWDVLLPDDNDFCSYGERRSE